MPKYYLLDENKNLVEGFDKEGFLALLEQAIEQGSLENIDENSAVASKIRSVLNGTTHHIEFVTQAQFNQLEADGQLEGLTYYFITDDTTEQGLNEAVERAQQTADSAWQAIEKLQDGTWSVGRADYAETIAQKLYEHTIFIYGEGVNSGSVTNKYQFCFTLKTDGTYEEIDEDIDDILYIVNQIYGSQNFVQASGFRLTISDSSIYPCIGLKTDGTYINLVTGIHQGQISFMQYQKSTVKKIIVNTRQLI